MKFGSLFAGVGGFDLGLERAGMTPVWQVEKDHQCRAVLRRHWPNADLHEDVRHVGGSNLASVDLICGGFPCQDLSVAGRRAGLEGERSGLWFEFHRIVSELAPRWVLIENVPGLLSGCGCALCRAAQRVLRVHERVRSRSGAVACDLCHALERLVASHTGRNMAIVLSGLAELGYVGAWRVLDSQYVGVAQRRRRVFLLATRDPGAPSPAEVLALAEGVSGHPAPGREAGERVANALTGCSGKKGEPDDNAAQGGHVVATHDVAPTLQERSGKGVDSDCTAALAFQCHGSNIGPMGTLRRGNGSTQSGVLFVVDEQNAAAVEMVGALGTGLAHGNRGFAVAQAFKSSHYTRGKDGAPSEVAPPISADADRGDQDTLVFNWQSGGDCRGLSPQEKPNALHVGQVPAVFRKAQKAHDADDCERWEHAEHAEHAGTLAGHSTTSSEVALAFALRGRDGGATAELGGDRANALRSSQGGGDKPHVLAPAPLLEVGARTNGDGYRDGDGIGEAGDPMYSLQAGKQHGIAAAVPRKLTPTECERLQGWPDGHTAWGVDADGNRVEVADGPRYRMAGNGVTATVSAWIGARLMGAEADAA